MRLIDADTLKKTVCKNCELREAGLCEGHGTGGVLGCFADEIDNEPTVDAVTAEEFVEFFIDEPCNYNDMDELTAEWCEKNCENHCVLDCWKMAIREKWFERKKGGAE